MRTTNNMQAPFIICMLLLSLFGAFVVHYSTHWGPAVHGDSTEYIASAKNLLAGHGLGVYAPSGRFRPLGYFPPFYPLTLSTLGFMGMDIIEAARMLNVVLLSITILLIGLSFYNLSRLPWVSVLLTLLIFTSPELLINYLSAMSESLFIFTGFAGLFLLVLYLEKIHRPILAAAAITTGLALLTRNTGLAFVIAGALCLVIFQRQPLKRRVTDSALYVLLSAIPMILWRIWLYVQPHMVSTQRFQYHAGNIWERLLPARLTFVDILWGWLPFNEVFSSPTYRFKLIFIILIGLLMGVSFIWAIRRIYKQGAQDWITHRGIRFTSLLLIFILSYIFILVVAFLFVYPTFHVDERHFSPIFVAVLISLFSIYSLFTEAWPSRKWLQVLPSVVTLIAVAAWLPSSYEMVLEHHQEGAGYTSVRWHYSGIIDDLKELSADIPIITNEPTAVLFHTGRSAYEIEELSRTVPLTDYVRYGEKVDDPVQQLFRSEGAALVLFDSFYWQLYAIYDEKTPQRIEAFTQGLRLYSDTWDGEIYFYEVAEH